MLDIHGSQVQGYWYTQSNLLQMVQNVAVCLVHSQPKRAHVLPLFISLHWILVGARIKFKILNLTNRVATSMAPIYLNPLIQFCSPHSLQMMTSSSVTARQEISIQTFLLVPELSFSELEWVSRIPAYIFQENLPNTPFLFLSPPTLYLICTSL